jgi:hypothetical protein
MKRKLGDYIRIKATGFKGKVVAKDNDNYLVKIEEYGICKFRWASEVEPLA